MQRAEYLNNDNEKDIRVKSFKTELSQKIREPIQTKLKKDSSEQESQIMTSRLEFFTGYACCQALIFKSWVEASDKLIKKIQTEKGNQENLGIPSLYVDIHEDVFTNLFKSSEYASNLGRMINASMLIMKNWQILAKNDLCSPNQDYSNKDKR